MKVVKKQEFLPKIPRKLRVAAYARVSSNRDHMMNSLSAQVSYYNNLIQKRLDWEFVGVYADEAISGVKDTRPEFQRLLADCRDGKIDKIITKSVTRFARNTVTTLETVRELKLLGIDVYFERENIHSISGDGELMLTILASYAQEEARSVSDNLKWRIRHKYKDGRPHSIQIYGYKLVDGTLIVVPEEAEIVRMIFADYLNGLSCQDIAAKLDAFDIPTMRGGKWSHYTIRKMLHNEKYKGDMLLQKCFIDDHISKKQIVNIGQLPMYYIEDAHEAIIDKDTWMRVKKEFARRVARSQPRLTPRKPSRFTRKIVCGQCGRFYICNAAYVGTPNETISWVCPTRKRKGKYACYSQSLPEYVLREIVDMDFEVIRVPEPHIIVIVQPDGTEVERHWEYKTPNVQWTKERQERASARMKKSWEERRKNNATSEEN